MDIKKDKLNLLIKNMPDAFAYHLIITDEEGKPVDYRFLAVNSAFENMTGLSRDEVVGQRVTDLFKDFKRSSFDWIGVYGKVAQTGECACFESYFEPLDRWYAVTAYSDEPGHFAAIFHDISDVKRNEAVLVEREKEFRSIFELASVGIVQVNPLNGQMVRYNEKYREITGYSDQELKEISFPSLTHPEDREQDWEIFTRAKRGETPYYQNEKRYIRQDGSIVWVRVNAAFIRDEKGEAYRTIAVCEDVTARKMAEEELAKKEALLRGIIDHSQYLIYAKDLDGRFILVSQSLIAFFGCREEKELLGKTSHHFLPRETADQHQANDQAVIAHKKLIALEETVKAEEKTLYYLTVKFPLFDADGRIYAVCGISVDITARKEASAALEFQLEFEKVVSDISSFFVKLPAERLDRGIDYALKVIGEFFHADRSYLIRISDDSTRYSVTHEWCAKGVESQKGRLANISLDHNPWWFAQIISNRQVSIADVGKMPPEAARDRSDFAAQGIKSILSIPLLIDDKVSGCLCFDAVGESKIWPEKTITLLNVVVELIAGALKQYITDQRIRYLSFHDQLTGLYNRRFLEEEMERMDTARQLPQAVIVADVNCLKLANDVYGHGRGDEMLKAATAILKGSCREEDLVARWGGDEFVILLKKTTQKDAEAVYRRVIANCSGTHIAGIPISMSLGLAVRSDNKHKISHFLKVAEGIMYREKIKENIQVKDNMLQSMLQTLAAKSHETDEHIKAIWVMSQKIARHFDLSNADLKRLKALAAYHDIGMMTVDGNILMKQDNITSKEMAKIRKHPETGFLIARAISTCSDVAEEILSHHERWDGTGYPRGLKGDKIPQLARILAAADAYEAMRSGRPYKKTMNRKEIIAELQKCSGSQFDPDVVQALLKILANNFGTQ